MNDSIPPWRARGGYRGGYRGKKGPANHRTGNQASENPPTWCPSGHGGNNNRGLIIPPRPSFPGIAWSNGNDRGRGRGRGSGQKRGGGKPRHPPTTTLFTDNDSDDDDYPIRRNTRGSKPPTPPPGMYGMPLLPAEPICQIPPPIPLPQNNPLNMAPPSMPLQKAVTVNPVPPPKLSKVAFIQRGLQNPLPVPPRPPPVRSPRPEQSDENFYEKHRLSRLSAPVDLNNNDPGIYPPPNFYSAIHKDRKIHANRSSRNWDGGCSGGFAQNVQSRARFPATSTDKQRTDDQSSMAESRVAA